MTHSIASGTQRDYQDRQFFKLTLLSEQLNHKNFNIVKSIDTEQLYNEARAQGAFTGYREFITKELDKYYLLQTKNADPERFLGKENELKDYIGARILVDVNTLQGGGYEGVRTILDDVDEDDEDGQMPCSTPQSKSSLNQSEQESSMEFNKSQVSQNDEENYEQIVLKEDDDQEEQKVEISQKQPKRSFFGGIKKTLTRSSFRRRKDNNNSITSSIFSNVRSQYSNQRPPLRMSIVKEETPIDGSQSNFGSMISKNNSQIISGGLNNSKSMRLSNIYRGRSQKSSMVVQEQPAIMDQLVNIQKSYF